MFMYIFAMIESMQNTKVYECVYISRRDPILMRCLTSFFEPRKLYPFESLEKSKSKKK